MLLFLTMMVILGELHVFLQLCRIGLFGKNENFSSLKCLTFRKYSFQKLPQLSQGVNVLNAVVSNIHGFVWRDPCVSSTQLNRPMWSNRAFLHLETAKLQEVFLS
jgi:hypothetical protein